MKFTITFKTPDVLDGVLEEYKETHCEYCDEFYDGCVNCLQLVERNTKATEAIKACGERFIKYGECISIEFDTDANTATVLPVRK
jgi:hypothetical protein